MLESAVVRFETGELIALAAIHAHPAWGATADTLGDVEPGSTCQWLGQVGQVGRYSSTWGGDVVWAPPIMASR